MRERDGTPGNRASIISATRSSWSGLTIDHSSDTPIASAPEDATASRTRVT
jgi:hypothetical protein